MEFLVGFDKGVSFALDSQVVPRFGGWGLDRAMVFFTHLGDQLELRITLLAAVILLALSRRFLHAALVVGAFLSAHALSNGTKSVVQRPRPDFVHSPLARPQSYSFPSGHALESTALYVTIALVAARGWTRQRMRRWLAIGSLVLVFLIGSSRVYLGVHYATDVIGGWAAGLAIALTCAWFDERWQPFIPGKDLAHQP
jgi:undecaprenyl-diphosphatase